MSSDEDDYMSDTFLKGCVKEDIRPGLIRSHSDKRNHEMLKKRIETNETNKIYNRPKGFVEKERRDDALSQPISSDNKGFALLQKLGYKPGSGLGKSSTGRTEPVPIQLKTDRQGLGRAEALNELAIMKANIKKEMHNRLTNINDYRSQLSEKASEKRAGIDLRKSQRICKQLDFDLGILKPVETWFWPEEEQKTVSPSDNDDDDDDWHNDNDEKVSKENIDDDDDDGDDGCDEQEEEEKEEEDEYEFTVKEKLEMITLYLRETYYYCIWCAVQYDDERDLQHECPGKTYEDH